VRNVFLARRPEPGQPRQELTAGCPGWMRWGFYLAFGYLFVNLLWAGERESGSLRVFSGFWMAFYTLAAVRLYGQGRFAENGG
jgi:hypothetical protein